MKDREQKQLIVIHGNPDEGGGNVVAEMGPLEIFGLVVVAVITSGGIVWILQ